MRFKFHAVDLDPEWWWRIGVQNCVKVCHALLLQPDKLCHFMRQLCVARKLSSYHFTVTPLHVIKKKSSSTTALYYLEHSSESVFFKKDEGQGLLLNKSTNLRNGLAAWRLAQCFFATTYGRNFPRARYCANYLQLHLQCRDKFISPELASFK